MKNPNTSSSAALDLKPPTAICASYHPVSPSIERAVGMVSEDPHRMVRVSPTDGRYASKMKILAPYVCEAQLARMRMIVEAEWFRYLFLSILPTDFAKDHESLVTRLAESMKHFANTFSIEAATEVSKQEDRFKHDVIAMLSVLRDQLEKEVGLEENRDVLLNLLSMIHLGLTSEDVSSTSHSLMIVLALKNIIKPACDDLVEKIRLKAQDFRGICDPTCPDSDLATRYARYADRIKEVASKVVAPDYLAVKFSGATGTHAALSVIAKSGVDVPLAARRFVTAIAPELVYLPVTAQINPHDDLALWCLQVNRLRMTLQDICWEIWEDSGQDVSIDGELIKLLSIVPDGEQSGSSAMPQKIQVILIENALGTASCFGGLAAEFSKSINVNRLQRELSDSRIIREIFGVVLPELLSTFQNMATDIPKLRANPRCCVVNAGATATAAGSLEGNATTTAQTLEALADHFIRAAKRLADTPFLARTHNQPASPTTFGKELRVFAQRLEYLVAVIKKDLFGRTGAFTWEADDVLEVAKGILTQFFDDLRIYVTKRNGAIAVKTVPEFPLQSASEEKNAATALQNPKLLGELLDTLLVSDQATSRELEAHYESLGEAVQTVLRRYGVWDAYERVKRVTRGATMDRTAYQEMVRELLSESPVHTLIPLEVQTWLLDLKPSGFTGCAAQLARGESAWSR